MDRALGTLMCCVAVGGVVDVLVTGRYGAKWFSHAVGTAAFGVVGGGFCCAWVRCTEGVEI